MANLFIEEQIVSFLCVRNLLCTVYIHNKNAAKLMTERPVTFAPITRTKMRTIKMHALDWLNEHGCALR